MTFSIVARDGDFFGVAVASKFLGVGGVVPGVRRGVGAVATQSFARVGYLEELLDALEAGEDPAAALTEATGRDEGRALRQVGVVGLDGAASYTGEDCYDWAGGRTGPDYAIQGNILAGEDGNDYLDGGSNRRLAALASMGRIVSRVCSCVSSCVTSSAACGSVRNASSNSAAPSASPTAMS